MRVPRGTRADVLDFRRSGCRHTTFLRTRECCLLFEKKNLTGRSARLLPTLTAQTGTEVGVAESRQAGPQVAKQAEESIEENRGDTVDDRNRGAGSQAA